jgi:DNA gyrase subunit A
MPIYRMTKEEVEKRALMVKDDTVSLKEFDKIANSKSLIEKKLIEELHLVDEKLTAWLKQKDVESHSLLKKLDKESGKKTIKPKTTKK